MARMPRREHLARLLAVCALGLALGGAQAAPAYEPLVDALTRNENAKVRLSAAKRLARFKAAPVQAALTFALEDPDATVRAQAADSLGKVGDANAFQPLCDLRRDRDPLVQSAARGALERFGGETACKAAKVFVEIEVTADHEPSRRAVEKLLLAKATQNQRIVLGRAIDLAGQGEAGPDPRDELQAGRMKGVAMKVHLTREVTRTASSTLITCAGAQSLYQLPDKALRASATQRVGLDLGSPKVTDQAIDTNAQACLEHLGPVLYDEFDKYLRTLK